MMSPGTEERLHRHEARKHRHSRPVRREALLSRFESAQNCLIESWVSLRGGS